MDKINQDIDQEVRFQMFRIRAELEKKFPEEVKQMLEDLPSSSESVLAVNLLDDGSGTGRLNREVIVQYRDQEGILKRFEFTPESNAPKNERVSYLSLIRTAIM